MTRQDFLKLKKEQLISWCLRLQMEREHAVKRMNEAEIKLEDFKSSPIICRACPEKDKFIDKLLDRLSYDHSNCTC